MQTRRVRHVHSFAAAIAVLALGCRAEGAVPAPGRVRAAVHAGSWYPADGALLRATLEGWLSAASASIPGLASASAPTSGPASAPASKSVPASALASTSVPASSDAVVAVVAPHAGMRFSGAVAGAAYAALGRAAVKRVFILGPSHQEAFVGIALPATDISAFATPLGALRVDATALAALRGKPGFDGPASAQEREHSIEMQLPFVALLAPQASIVPMVVGRVGDVAAAERLAASLRPLLGAGDIVVVSSDFTHYGESYGYVPFTAAVPERLTELATQAVDALTRVDAVAFAAHLASTGDTICGREPLAVLLALLPPASRGTRLAFDTSGRMLGDWQTSVSYVALAFTRAGGFAGAVPARHSSGATAPAATAVTAAPGTATPAGEAGQPMVLDAAGQAFALGLARRTLEIVLAGGAVPDAVALRVPSTPVWQASYGTFVTLKRHNELRGCIGHIEAVEPLWRDVRDNAIAAALQDPRFAKVTQSELAGLGLEISVLTPLRRIAAVDEFEVGRHGIVLALGGRRAVFLPQVAPEQGWDRVTTLNHLASKAGLPMQAWRDVGAQFDVFTAQVFGEPSR